MTDAVRLPEPEYQPGVCNIGGPEIARRQLIGWIGTALTLVIGAAMLALSAPVWSFVVLFITGFTGATGFIQARGQFCSGFGAHGMSQFGELGDEAAVAADADALAADKARAKKITRQSALAGIVVAVVFMIIAAVIS